MSIITRNDGSVPDSGSNGAIAVQTTVSTTAIKIAFPDDASSVIIRHLGTTTVWIGSDSSITAGGTTVFPMIEGDVLSISLKKGNDNSLYAIVASGSVTVYTLGEILA